MTNKDADKERKTDPVLPKSLAGIKEASSGQKFYRVTGWNNKSYSEFENGDQEKLEENFEKLAEIIKAEENKCIEIEYIEKPNPNGEQPYRNIKHIDFKEEEKEKLPSNREIKEKYRNKQVATYEEAYIDATKVKENNINPEARDIDRIAEAIFNKRCPPYHYYKQRKLKEGLDDGG